MRALVVAVVSAAVLTACGTGADDAPRGGPAPASASPTATLAQPDHERVAAALRKTREAKTAAFVVEGTNELLEGTVTLRRTGSYDLGRGHASVVQTLSSDPPDLLRSLLGERAAAAGDMEVQSVLTRTHAFMRMPAWGAKTRGRWLTMSQRDIDKAGLVAADLDSSIFPVQLEMLAHAQAASGPAGAADPSVATVDVPARHAFEAIPSSTPRKMIAAGLEPADLTGTVQVQVTIADGLITRVAFDAIDVFLEAAAELGQDGAGDQVSALPSFIELSAHGAPAGITVPPPAQRITPAEFGKLR